LGNRIDNGPVYSPDGTEVAYALGGTLRISEVDSSGSPVGPAREVNGESADSPSWSGDSRTLLHLNGDRLRMADPRTGRSRPVQTRLPWRRAKPTGRTVIQAGAMWACTSPRLRRDVDNTLDGNRILAVSPRGTGAARRSNRTVNART
jgi:hypothetical protein